MPRPIRTSLLLLPAVLVAAAALLALPLVPRDLHSRPRPARSYAAAVTGVQALLAEDSGDIARGCGTLFLTHGARTPHVVVMFHGLTNCPAQFDSLARLAFAAGANVLVPRLPHHGFADRMTDELARAEARELRAFADRTLDAAHGLGDSVTVVGLSIGGVLAAWAGQERADVDRAVAVAPMLGWARAPGPLLTPAITRLGLLLPNRFVWWDDARKQDLPGPRHVYPRFSSRSVAATMLLGGAVRRAAARTAPAARSLVMITVGGDPAADNGAAAALVRTWRARGAREVLEYEFPASLHLNHDVVDPEQVGGHPAITYPVLLRYIAR